MVVYYRVKLQLSNISGWKVILGVQIANPPERYLIKAPLNRILKGLSGMQLRMSVVNATKHISIKHESMKCLIAVLRYYCRFYLWLNSQYRNENSLSWKKVRHTYHSNADLRYDVDKIKKLSADLTPPSRPINHQGYTCCRYTSIILDLRSYRGWV